MNILIQVAQLKIMNQLGLQKNVTFLINDFDFPNTMSLTLVLDCKGGRWTSRCSRLLCAVC